MQTAACCETHCRTGLRHVNEQLQVLTAAMQDIQGTYKPQWKSLSINEHTYLYIAFMP